jgi:hypothetical protein
MVTPFAATLAALNEGVEATLANARATWQGGEPFGVMFDSAAADPLGGGAVDASACTVAFDIAHAPGLAEGGELAIDGVAYVVSSGVLPDASGWVALSVYPKA